MINDETIVDVEPVMSWEMDKNASSTTDFLVKKTGTDEKLNNSEQSSILPDLDINDFAYSLEDLLPSSTSTNLDDFVNLRKNFSEEIVERKENEAELKASTISESVQRISSSRNDYDENKKIKSKHRSSHILNLIEMESSITPMDNGTAISEVSEIISKGSSVARSSTTTIIPDVLETTRDENIGQFALEKSTSTFATDLLAILTKSSRDFTETLTTTSLSASDKELLMTTNEPRLTDDLQKSSSSQTANSLFEDSDLSTLQTTMSSDDAIDVVGLISDTNQRLISDSGSSTIPSVIPITSSTTDESKISDSFDHSTESSNLNMENFITFAETSMIKPEDTVEVVKEIDDITTSTVSEVKTITSTGIPKAVFNITIPSSLVDPKYLSG
ncbi:unnamed protein product, partial [Onchocerca flexuosa]|uniref:Aggrecan core protein n=1 Tax=Onchocerca flexuosa TaxID=387005 RepID=A0A183HUE7_9BILA